MTVWRRSDGLQAASSHTRAIFTDIERHLAKLVQPRPQVASIRVGARLYDLHDFEVEIDLAPGARAAIRYQSVDEDGRDPDALEGEAGAVAFLTSRAIEQYRSVGFATLADMLQDMRARTRQELVAWQSNDAFVTFGDIRLAWDEHSHGQDALAVELRLRSINDHLRPYIQTIEVRRPGRLDAVLAGARAGITSLYRTRAALAAQGADGIIDRLALNAIAQHHNVSSTLRRLMNEQPYAYRADLTLFIYGGHIQCHGWDPVNPEVHWNRDTVTIFGKSAPDTVLHALNGHPVTKLVEHPVLSDDMLVTRAWTTIEGKEHAIHAEFTQPRLLVCGASGRVWSAQV